MKIYALICLFRGRLFSFHATNEENAIRKVMRYCANHNVKLTAGFKVKEVLEHLNHDLNNELVK